MYNHERSIRLLQLLNASSRRTILCIGAAIAFSACGGDHGSATTTQPINVPGTLQMTISRSASSQIPAIADSAAVRVWHPAAGTNQVQLVAIPSPGSNTNVSFNLPALSGYSVGVIAYHRSYDGSREALAGGRTDNVTILADQVATATVDVEPWSVTLSSTPDPIVSGEPVTYRAQINGPSAADFFAGGYFYTGLDKWTANSSRPTPPIGAMGWEVATNSLISVTAAAPTVLSDTALRVQVVFGGRDNVWGTQNGGLYFYAPSFALGDTLYRRGIKVPAGGLVVQF